MSTNLELYRVCVAPIRVGVHRHGCRLTAYIFSLLRPFNLLFNTNNPSRSSHNIKNRSINHFSQPTPIFQLSKWVAATPAPTPTATAQRAAAPASKCIDIIIDRRNRGNGLPTIVPSLWLQAVDGMKGRRVV
ncbi:hypothetical protein DOTSEDRAFT_68449 [Dothistroma septosporum NZE10]|uniref:Uncharacterized protein n=1 Tax=Dothistroma septosporum (strain NZE10 / CBS 128990) TaxID=675120 RepID=N1Q4G0_DOTSN|nr:hypothetical protein DOTSEDRAFT_68449 [Dothistroma septosporum NZE10]